MSLMDSNILYFNRRIAVASAAFATGAGMSLLRVSLLGDDVENATIEVAAGGDITVKSGDRGSEAADALVGLPTKNGIYDVSDGDANTLLEIINDLNASGRYFACAVDIPPSMSSNNTFATLSATDIKRDRDGGTLLAADYAEIDILKSGVFTLGIGLHPSALDDTESEEDWALRDRQMYPTRRHRPYFRAVLDYVLKQTTAVGATAATDLLLLYRIRNGDLSTEEIIHSQETAATTVQFTLPETGQLGPILEGNPGDQYFIVLESSDDTTPDPANFVVRGKIELSGHGLLA
jgi:hypothetical protein